MRRTIGIIVLVFFSLNCTYTAKHYLTYEKAGLIAVSERVGETIDPEEREQFALFNGIADFKAAYFYDINGGGCEIEILTVHQKFAAVNRDENTIVMIRDYIDRYEEIKESKARFEEKWEIVAYDTLGFPITKSEVNRYCHPAASWGCGIGSGLFIIGCSIFAAALIDVMGLDPPTPAETRKSNIVLAVGTLLGITTGVMIGIATKSSDELKSIALIREAREPRVVE